MSKSLRLRWASKLTKAKFFVVMTDKESVIALEGANPESFEDIMALQAQAAEIEAFLERLKDLKRTHDKLIERKMNVKKTKKIKVKEG